jgi:hypothetical protein
VKAHHNPFKLCAYAHSDVRHAAPYANGFAILPKRRSVLAALADLKAAKARLV